MLVWDSLSFLQGQVHESIPPIWLRIYTQESDREIGCGELMESTGRCFNAYDDLNGRELSKFLAFIFDGNR